MDFRLALAHNMRLPLFHGDGQATGMATMDPTTETTKAEMKTIKLTRKKSDRGKATMKKGTMDGKRQMT